MSSATVTMDQNKENPSELARAIIKNWHLVAVIIGLIVSIVVSWTHFEAGLAELKGRVDFNEQQANVLTANYQAVSPEISAINAKLDILLKQNGL